MDSVEKLGFILCVVQKSKAKSMDFQRKIRIASHSANRPTNHGKTNYTTSGLLFPFGPVAEGKLGKALRRINALFVLLNRLSALSGLN
jgi:hypothetical protein